MAEIDREAWLQALHAEEYPEHPDALTCNELTQLLGRSRTNIKGRLKKAVQEGRVGQVFKRVQRADGRVTVVPAYQLKLGETL